ncbi:uncharacterized protein F5Z01DRAFT_629098, partial [Emericellopsis atlantica]
LADKWAARKTYHDCCGPAETTIANTMHKYARGGALTVGKPTSGKYIYSREQMQLPLSVYRA